MKTIPLKMRAAEIELADIVREKLEGTARDGLGRPTRSSVLRAAVARGLQSMLTEIESEHAT